MEKNIPLAICLIWFVVLLVHSSIASFYFTKGKGRKAAQVSMVVTLIISILAVVYGALVYLSVISGQPQVAQSLVIPGVVVVSVVTTMGEATKIIDKNEG